MGDCSDLVDALILDLGSLSRERGREGKRKKGGAKREEGEKERAERRKRRKSKKKAEVKCENFDFSKIRRIFVFEEKDGSDSHPH